MLNTLWTVLLLAGIGWGTLTGNARATGEALLEGAASGVSLCMTMFGVLALWSGILEIASTSGLMDAISRRMRPLLHWLFPRIPDGHPALAPIATNLTANLFGLGWAATPAGLGAMERWYSSKKSAALPDSVQKMRKIMILKMLTKRKFAQPVTRCVPS